MASTLHSASPKSQQRPDQASACSGSAVYCVAVHCPGCCTSLCSHVMGLQMWRALALRQSCTASLAIWGLLYMPGPLQPDVLVWRLLVVRYLPAVAWLPSST